MFYIYYKFSNVRMEIVVTKFEIRFPLVILGLQSIPWQITASLKYDDRFIMCCKPMGLIHSERREFQLLNSQ